GKGEGFGGEGIDVARECKEVAAQFHVEHAMTLALFDDCGQAKEEIAKAFATARVRSVMLVGGRALALCGEAGSAQPIIDELSKRWPTDTVLNNIWSPLISAPIEVRRNNPAKALELLETARRYERAASFVPQYLRGQAYLAQNKGKEAASEFQTILDHRGWSPSSPIYPLANLGLARAASSQGDNASARKSYQ